MNDFTFRADLPNEFLTKKNEPLASFAFTKKKHTHRERHKRHAQAKIHSEFNLHSMC